ncbi:MAG: hypothetical protein ABFD50_19365 [Smithella sp.]
MKTVCIAIISILLAGCAVQSDNIRLDTTPSTSNVLVTVVDTGSETEMTFIPITGEISVFEVTPSPAIATVLKELLSSSKKKIDVNITETKFKAKVGFMANDILSCQIKSNVTFGATSTDITTKSIYSKSMSVLRTTMEKIIVDQCLRDHAVDILKITNR